MKAIILVAGYATRLYPLTIDRPKALLPINDKPILDYIVDEVNTIPAVDSIYVVSNHKFAGHFADWAAESKSRIPVTVLDDGTTTEADRKGAIGDILFCVKEKQIDDETIIINGDNYFTFSLLEYYNYYKETSKDCVCVKVLDDVAQLRQFAVAKLDENNKVIELVEKPSVPASNNAVFGTYIYTQNTMTLFQQYLNDGNNPDAPGYFVQWLYKRRDVYAYIMNGDCYDIGTPESYREVQELCK